MMGMIACSDGSSSLDELLPGTAVVIINNEEFSAKQFKAEFDAHKKKFRMHRTEAISPEELTRKEWEYIIENNLSIKKLISNFVNSRVDGVSDIIRTPYGFHLFEVVDKIKKQQMSFHESKKQVEQILLQKLQDSAFRKWLIKLKEKSEIKIKYDFLEKIN